MYNQFYINNSNINNTNEEIIPENNKINTTINYKIERRTNEQIMADDLLSTHPFMGSNIYDIDQNNEDSQELLNNARITTKEVKKIFIISSRDRNPYYEHMYNFSVKFNPSGNIFERVPIYFNNPTIPQTNRQMELGIIGDKNINGWRDSQGNNYPPYRGDSPPGDIVTYDSLLTRGTTGAYIPYKIKNLTSLKIEKFNLPVSVTLLQTASGLNGIFSNYISITLTNIDSNYHCTSPELERSTEIMIPDDKSIFAQGWWIPISTYSPNYNPPRNSVNTIKITWDSGTWASQSNHAMISPMNYSSIIGVNSAFTSSADILKEFWFKDIVKIYGIEFSGPYIILKTSFFSGSSSSLWKMGAILSINNIIDNINIQNFTSEQISSLASITEFLRCKNHIIIGSAFIINGEDITNQINNENPVINNIFQQIGFGSISTFIKNRIIITGPEIIDIDEKLNSHQDIIQPVDTIGKEKIILPPPMKEWDSILRTFFDNKVGKIWQELYPDGILFNNTMNENWTGKGPYVMNLSMQILIVVSATILEPCLANENISDSENNPRNNLNT